MSEPKLAYTYDEKQNPDGAHLPGVPLADISAEQANQLPFHAHAAIEAQPFYTKVKGYSAPKPPVEEEAQPEAAAATKSTSKKAAAEPAGATKEG